MKAGRLFIFLVLALLPFSLPAGRPLKLRPPLQVDHDHSPIGEPVERNVSEIYAIAYNSWLRHLNPGYKAAVAADPGALNVNAWDEVPESSWFANRNGLRSLSFDQITAGLNETGTAPVPGQWKVTKIGDEGYTPKIDMIDPQGRRYVLKFDLPSALERNSAAERICTLIMHAAGYNVPHNSIVYFRPENLELSPDAKYSNAIGEKEPLTLPIFESMLKKLKPLADGRYRGLASLYIPGKPIGRFVYIGKREDDPNDLIPHELRRELRGFRVIASWINHVDVGDKNALDVFVAGKDKRGYVRHYLLDFGSTMGSGDFVNGPYRVGHEYIFDGPAIGKSFVTLGIWSRPWDAQGRILHPEAGYFQAELFEPADWKPNYPNLAFEQMDDSDGYWGAKIVTSFSDETISGIVQSGEYTRAEVSRYMTDVLQRRRDAIGRYWLTRVTPLEEFALSREGANYRLSFRDLSLERGYDQAENRAYRFWIESPDGKMLTVPQDAQRGRPQLDLPADALAKADRPQLKPDRYGRTPIARLLIRTQGGGSGQALPVEVVLGFKDGGTQLEVLGWYHAAR